MYGALWICLSLRRHSPNTRKPFRAVLAWNVLAFSGCLSLSSPSPFLYLLPLLPSFQWVQLKPCDALCLQPGNAVMPCTYPSGWAKHTNSSSQGHAQEEKGEWGEILQIFCFQTEHLKENQNRQQLQKMHFLVPLPNRMLETPEILPSFSTWDFSSKCHGYAS